MESRDLLIYLSIKNEGDWDKIYADITNQVFPDDEEEAFKLIHKIKSKVVTIMDEDYPEPIKRSYRPPFVLYYYGDLSLAKDRCKNISVVGARKNTNYGKMMCENLVSVLCQDYIIVSGLAMGIDSISHQTAVDNAGKTIAVLGSGINICYPKQNEDLYKKICKKHLVLSEYPDDVQPSANKFPKRNRIIAALSNCLLIIEGKRNSGTSITATMMLENGGDVCCVPTRALENSICNHLIAYGAFLVETADDVLDVVGRNKSEPIF